MGCCCPYPRLKLSGRTRSESQISRQEYVQEIEKFIGGISSLEELWQKFDSNGDGTIDMDEFENLVFHTVWYFCSKRCPDNPPTKKEDFEGTIQDVIAQVRQFVDKDNDEKITKAEFKNFGAYLIHENKVLQSEMKTNG